MLERPNRSADASSPRSLRVCAAVLLLGAGLAADVTQPQEPRGLAALDFLIGRWEGTSDGMPGNGIVRREYARVLGSQFIEVRNVTTYEPQPRNPKGERHEDVGYLSFDRAHRRLVFRQFHVEGFVNQYVAEPAANGVIVFTSETIENIPAGWRARETYRAVGPDAIEEQFELAEPGKEFELYSRARLRRVQ